MYISSSDSPNIIVRLWTQHKHLFPWASRRPKGIGFSMVGGGEWKSKGVVGEGMIMSAWLGSGGVVLGVGESCDAKSAFDRDDGVLGV